MGDEPKTELLSTLANQAVKNDGDVCGGNDLLFLQEAFDSYQRSSLPLKDRHLVSAGFFLGRIPKRYEVFGAYGDDSEPGGARVRTGTQFQGPSYQLPLEISVRRSRPKG